MEYVRTVVELRDDVDKMYLKALKKTVILKCVILEMCTMRTRLTLSDKSRVLLLFWKLHDRIFKRYHMPTLLIRNNKYTTIKNNTNSSKDQPRLSYIKLTKLSPYAWKKSSTPNLHKMHRKLLKSVNLNLLATTFNRNQNHFI